LRVRDVDDRVAPLGIMGAVLDSHGIMLAGEAYAVFTAIIRMPMRRVAKSL
jgi:hypothetical protein